MKRVLEHENIETYATVDSNETESQLGRRSMVDMDVDAGSSDESEETNSKDVLNEVRIINLLPDILCAEIKYLILMLRYFSLITKISGVMRRGSVSH